MNQKKLFGTDGIRRKANDELFNQENLYCLVWAIVKWAEKNNFSSSFLIGRDTRESSPRITNRIKKGLRSISKKIMDVGVIPTPGLAHLSHRENCIGIMVTASHNSYCDNGIKIFLKGRKLSDMQEAEIEELYSLAKKKGITMPKSRKDIIKVNENTNHSYLKNIYTNWLLKQRICSINAPLVVIDCGHGAVSEYAKTVLKNIFPSCLLINNEPNGKNINENCGAIAPKEMCQIVRDKNADLGVAFDGDGDRAVFCDEKGNIIDGDQIIAFLAKDIGRDGVVYTEYSNKALDNFLEAKGINFFRVECGDKKVVEEMAARCLSFGGEESGHYIFSDNLLIGDGIFSAMKVIKLLGEKGIRASEVKFFEPLPKVKISVEVKEKKEFSRIKDLSETIKEVESYLGRNSRIFLRYSGTEDKARILAEGEDEKKCREGAQRVASVLEREVGLEKS